MLLTLTSGSADNITLLDTLAGPAYVPPPYAPLTTEMTPSNQSPSSGRPLPVQPSHSLLINAYSTFALLLYQAVAPVRSQRPKRSARDRSSPVLTWAGRLRLEQPWWSTAARAAVVDEGLSCTCHSTLDWLVRPKLSTAHVESLILARFSADCAEAFYH